MLPGNLNFTVRGLPDRQKLGPAIGIVWLSRAGKLNQQSLCDVLTRHV